MKTKFEYRFPKWKDAPWNSYERQRERYEIIKPYIGNDSIGAEIGVYKGGFGEFLLPHCRKLFLVDPWYRAGGFWKSSIDNDSRVDTVVDILQKYKHEIEAGRLEVVIEYSSNFLNSRPNDEFDFLYIDSSHRYEDTKKEIDIALRKVKSSGIILGDDCDSRPESRQYGVYRAIQETAQSGLAELVFIESRQWGLRPIKANP